MNWYRRYLQYLAVIASSRTPANGFFWAGILLAVLWCLWLLWQQQAGITWLPALLLICWCLLVLLIRVSPTISVPESTDRRWLDWYRRQRYRVKRHSLALLILFILLLTCFASLKMISVLIRQS